MGESFHGDNLEALNTQVGMPFLYALLLIYNFLSQHPSVTVKCLQLPVENGL